VLNNVFKVLISIRAKLFFGFFAMAALIVLLGGYSYVSIGQAERVVQDTYDRPLMAINFARSSSQKLAQIKIKTQDIRVAVAMGKPYDIEGYQELREEAHSDLLIARERSIAPKAEQFFDEIDALRAEWATVTQGQVLIEDGPAMQRSKEIYEQISENLDIIVELQTNESFRQQEASINNMKKIETYALGAMLIALLMTVLISAWIAVTIIYPLKAAAIAARKIAAGNLDAEIPKGGADETGVLLKSMNVMQDNIRARMDAEKSLRTLAQVRLAESLENSKDAVLLTDADGKIILANGALRAMFPSLGQINLTDQFYLDLFQVDGVSRTERCRLFPDVNELEFADGRWARVNASNTAEGGRLIIWTAITQSKEREVHLREAKDRAEAADQAKSMFLAAMSHELRTPLNAVIGFSDIIKTQSLGHIDNEKYVEMAGLISQSGAHLLHIVSDVLAISDGRDTESLSSEVEPIDMADVAKFCAATVEKKAADKDLTCIYVPPPQPLMVKGDRVRLQQILLNVLSNSIKYNRPNGVVKVSFGTSTNGQVRLHVTDTGIGIAEADMARIFEPFVQVDNSATRQYEGVGLGLPIVKKWTEQHGGTLEVRSKLGQGTQVTISLPLLSGSQSLSVTQAA